jgi:hypothetical protein
MVRPHAVLKLDKRILHVIAFAGHVVQSMTDNPNFPTPTPPLADVQADIDALTIAQSTVLSRTYGVAKIRDGYLATVRLDLARLRSYVQTLADRVNAELAAQLIASSGFSVKRRGVHPKQRAAAIPGPVSGSVRLTAPFAGKRAAYAWQYSSASGLWTALADTIQASTRVDSLTPGSFYRFQVRALTRAGIGDWGDPVVFLAL